MKKKVFLTLLVFLLFPLGRASAQTINRGALINKLPSAIPSSIGQNLDFAQLQNAVLTRLNMAIGRIDKAKAKIISSPLDEVTKSTFLSSLDKVEKGLSSYKAQVSRTTSLDDLRKLNQEITQYLKENKDVIIESARETAVILGTKVQKKAEQLYKQLEVLLKVLKITCPQQSSQITTLENQLVLLQSETAKLAEAIKVKDVVLIRSLTKELVSLGQDIAKNVQSIIAVCPLPTLVK